MEICPTCRAALRGRQICGRCKTDVGILLFVEETACRHRRAALEYLRSGNVEAARCSGERAVQLHESPESLATRCLVEFLSGDFRQALETWKAMQVRWPDIEVNLAEVLPDVAEPFLPIEDWEHDSLVGGSPDIDDGGTQEQENYPEQNSDREDMAFLPTF